MEQTPKDARSPGVDISPEAIAWRFKQVEPLRRQELSQRAADRGHPWPPISADAASRRYFKRYWNEVRGDEFDHWGCSWWYFETDESGSVYRQIEVYDRGPTHRYSDWYPEDDYGGLSKCDLDLGEFREYEIANAEFEQVWLKGPDSDCQPTHSS
jgi:hypothetical protein